MKKLPMLVLDGMLAAAMPLAANTWTDPDTGYTWTYRINGDTAEIYNDWSLAIGQAAAETQESRKVKYLRLFDGHA